MNGIVFFRTASLSQIVDFHTHELGGAVWLEQKDCTILQHGNLLVGFCRGEEPETGGLVTLFVDTRKEVDDIYHRLQRFATNMPRYNSDYAIYHFYGADPEGRPFEVQSFDRRPEL